MAEPDRVLASPQAAFAGGCQEPGEIRAEAAESNNVAKTTILYACSIEFTEVRCRTPDFIHSVFSVPSVVSPMSDLGFRGGCLTSPEV